MATFANVNPTAQTSSVPYATSKVIAATEADVYNETVTPDPIPTHGFAQGIVAVGTITITGTPDATSCYVVMQTDLGNGVWIDVAWFLTTAVTGTVTFALTAVQSKSNAIAQTRASGTAPGSTGANEIGLGDRVRFVGKRTFTNGTTPAATLTLGYKLLGLR